MNRKTSLLAAALSAGLAFSAHAATITQWDFNSIPSDLDIATGTLVPSTGAGTIGPIGGISTSFAGGNNNGGSTDPDPTLNDSGYQTTGYPAAQVGNKTAGLEFRVSTVGYENISVSWDQRHSNTSSRHVRLQYTLDITAGVPVWVDAAGFSGPAGDTWFNNRGDDFSSIAALDDNPNAAFRVVSEFDSTSGGYIASNGSSTYATTGTWRFDMVTVSGNVIPEPAALSLLALGGLAIIRRRHA